MADTCPRCLTVSEVRCDNDCGTYYCDVCNIDFHETARRGDITTFDIVITVGHNPCCGNDDDTSDEELWDSD